MQNIDQHIPFNSQRATRCRATMLQKKLTGLVLSLFVAVSTANAAVSYVGGSYTQDFDSLSKDDGQPAWSNGITLDSWYWADPDNFTASTYTVVNKEQGVSSGLANQQDRPLSLGRANEDFEDDRAFGTQTRSDNSDTIADFARFGVQLTNDTGATLNQFTLSFTAEQWRVINNEAADQLTFDYQVFSSGGSLTAASGWTDVAAFTFTARQTVASSIWLDGNAAANREEFSGTVTGINWNDGDELWLRWNDASMIGPDRVHAMMGIDDLSFTAAVVPEPTSITMILIGGVAMGLTFIRRKK
ncbi:PEP-CTERM sorting domain-containing protein [Kiritimatiellota bacterium B12222]|nr:PEP-CTERM sorting domain-containing protein [Kiritimatiellota bacterium B12222]